MAVLKTEAVSRFLRANTHKDLADLYNAGMECQVNVGQGDGERTGGEYKGARWAGFTDGLQTWKPFRIPWEANKDPHYRDSEVNWDFDTHVHAIGMTGWDWQNLRSRWVAFDFDAIAGHAEAHTKKLTDAEMEEVRVKACEIPWVTVRKSTGGRGLHLYVNIEDDTLIQTHSEHAAVARSILGVMSALAGFDFSSKVDICGQILWVWRRDMEQVQGLELISEGGSLFELPVNWRDQIDVVIGKKKRAIPGFVENSGEFAELAGQLDRVQLDTSHKRLLQWLQDQEAMWWWDADHHMLVTHTSHLREAHHALGFRGIFRTLAKGVDQQDHNCFLFPARDGAWTVRRYSKGASEHAIWDVDRSGWTFCYYNKEPTLKVISRAYDGVEALKGGFSFREAQVAAEAASYLGITVDIPNYMLNRQAALNMHKDGRIYMEVEKTERDDGGDMHSWLPDKKVWRKVFTKGKQGAETEEVHVFDDLIRHVLANDCDLGWAIYSDGGWKTEPLCHVQSVLSSLGHSATDLKKIIGASVCRGWKIVSRPFEPEYPGDRQWNRGAAQLRVVPSQNDNLRYPHWLKILNHIGAGLDSAVEAHTWCKNVGLQTGADYLKCWLASLFQNPTEPLPYLFLWGSQNCGKSILHESLSLLMTRGVMRADIALSGNSDFNGELEGAIVCVVEETDLRKNMRALNKIKDWVTSIHIPIRAMYKATVMVKNTTHWIQCNNSHLACPILPGDTRITMIHVDKLEHEVAKKEMLIQLEREASDFLRALLDLEIPESPERLRVPVITTSDKGQAAENNQNMLEMFLAENCFNVPGEAITVNDFTLRFHEWLDASAISDWSKIKIGREMPPQFPKGRMHKDGRFYFGNLSWERCEQTQPKWLFANQFLEGATSGQTANGATEQETETAERVAERAT